MLYTSCLVVGCENRHSDQCQMGGVRTGTGWLDDAQKQEFQVRDDCGNSRLGDLLKYRGGFGDCL